MKTIFVKWTYTNEYGTPCGYNYEWFETEAQAEEWKAEKKRNNGTWFYVYKTDKGDYAEFERMNALMKELETLKEKF